MPDSDADDPLDRIVTDAEKEREKFNKARSRLQEARERLRDMVDTLDSEGTIEDEEVERINGLIDDGEYSRARDAIRDAKEGGLEFDDEEKDIFARRFSESWEEMEASAEAVTTALLDFDQFLTEDDMVSYLYGKHSSLTKTEIREVLDTFNKIPESGLSTNDMARLLNAFNSNLTVRTTEKILGYIKDEADR